MSTLAMPKKTDHLRFAGRPPFVKVFAGIGAIIFLVFAHTLFRWIRSPDFKPAPRGPDPIPSLTLYSIRGFETLMVLVSIAFLWFVLVKPWRRDGKISWDGLMMLAMLTMWVQDPMCNYFNFTFSYNAYFLNMGSWTMYLPGWQAPRQGNLPEPLLFMGGVYLWVTVCNLLAFCWAMRKLRVLLPQVSILGHLPIVFVGLMLIDVMLDVPGPWLGVYAYSAGVNSATVWAGMPYQLPIYTVVAMSFHYMTLGLLRLYRDDRGESWAERGVQQLKLADGAKTMVRFLALVGFCNMSYFVNYFLPYNWFAMQADTMPKYPSYMRVDICGRGTPYACPSREVPIPSRTSLAIAPDDPRLPPQARQN